MVPHSTHRPCFSDARPPSGTLSLFPSSTRPPLPSQESVGRSDWRRERLISRQPFQPSNQPSFLPHWCGRGSLASPRLDGRWNDEGASRASCIGSAARKCSQPVLVVQYRQHFQESMTRGASKTSTMALRVFISHLQEAVPISRGSRKEPRFRISETSIHEEESRRQEYVFSARLPSKFLARVRRT